MAKKKSCSGFLQVVAHGQKDITSLVSLVRIKVFEVRYFRSNIPAHRAPDPRQVGEETAGSRNSAARGRREVENRKLVQLVSILTNQVIFSC